MNKNIYLSKREQMIFNLISTRDMAYSEEIEEVFPDLKPHQIKNNTKLVPSGKAGGKYIKDSNYS